MAIKIGITGGIGSGKTIVSNLLEIMGVPVYYTDDKAKKLTNLDPIIRQELISHFGEEVYVNSTLNKPFLASLLFSNKSDSNTINGIIHPRVKQDFRKWAIQRSSHPILGMESAILFESGFHNEVDFIIMVYAPLDIRIERIMQRDNSPQEAILKRIHNQMDDEIKKTMSDYIITNDNHTPLIPQVITLLKNTFHFEV